MDALSEALTSVHMTGAIFITLSAALPGDSGCASPARRRPCARSRDRATGQLSSGHRWEGSRALCGRRGHSCRCGRYPDHPPRRCTHGFKRRPSTFLDSGASLSKFLAGDLTTMRLGGGGETTRFVCGYFGCERHADRVFRRDNSGGQSPNRDLPAATDQAARLPACCDDPLGALAGSPAGPLSRLPFKRQDDAVQKNH
jgi:hypothetical protein